MECLLPYLCMVTVPHIMVGLERMLDYRGVRSVKIHCMYVFHRRMLKTKQSKKRKMQLKKMRVTRKNQRKNQRRMKGRMSKEFLVSG